MIYYENVEIIFMLCNLKENNKSQCDEYWPKKLGTNFEWPKGLENKELRVTLENEIIDQNLIERQFLVEKKNGENFEKKYVTQIQVL